MASRYEKEDSKRRILSACVQLFLEKGYQKTTTVEILKKAGVTPSTFYNIYHTKGSILTELTEFMFGNQFNISGKIVGEETNPVLLYAVETCLQLTLAELNENLREIYVEAYTVPENIELIHKKTAVQLQKIFAPYLPGYSASDFYEMEIGTAAFMRGYMARPCDMYFTLERKLARFLSGASAHLPPVFWGRQGSCAETLLHSGTRFRQKGKDHCGCEQNGKILSHFQLYSCSQAKADK